MTDGRDTPIIDLAAQRVAEARQHGCHYAEGTCVECREIAIAGLGAVVGWHLSPETPSAIACEIEDRDMPSEQPPRHVLVLLADQILADIKLEASDAVTLRNRIVGALMYVRHKAARMSIL